MHDETGSREYENICNMYMQKLNDVNISPEECIQNWMNDGNSSLLYDAKYVSRAWIYNGDGCVQFWKIIAKSHNHILLACIQLSIEGV